jgi:hypothetical protein
MDAFRVLHGGSIISEQGDMALRWLNDVEDDIKAFGIRRWRIKAQDRNEWTAIKREAKVKLKGP